MSIKMSVISLLSILALASCSSSKTIFITNKLGQPVTIVVDSSFSRKNGNRLADALNGKQIGKKLKLAFGSGKWTRYDKADLKDLLAHARFLDSNNTALPVSVSVRYIRLGVEELWVILKKQ